MQQGELQSQRLLEEPAHRGYIDEKRIRAFLPSTWFPKRDPLEIPLGQIQVLTRL